jgi:hypothetical protein
MHTNKPKKTGCQKGGGVMYQADFFKDYLVDFERQEFISLPEAEVVGDIPFASKRGRALLKGFQDHLEDDLKGLSRPVPTEAEKLVARSLRKKLRIVHDMISKLERG